jgi:chromatin segregation and condensation protein Rec8/ScpA/Scc1 (kleisin family)
MESNSRVNVSNPSASKKATSIASAITSLSSHINERDWARAACLILLGLVCFFPRSTGLADEVAPRAQTAQLQDRLERLEAREDAKYAKGALEQAQRALLSASGSVQDANAVARAQQIARAAMVLADRQLDRRRAQAELFATQRRLTATRERANAQRRALEALMRDRASLAREGEQP